MLSFFRWYFIDAPVWLFMLAWNVQHALVRAFSIPVMVRTFFMHWHKDAVSYRQGSITGAAVAFVWNLISRGIGMCIRAGVLVAWQVSAAVSLSVSAVLIGLFLAWPLLVVVGFVGGLTAVL